MLLALADIAKELVGVPFLSNVFFTANANAIAIARFKWALKEGIITEGSVFTPVCHSVHRGSDCPMELWEGRPPPRGQEPDLPQKADPPQKADNSSKIQ